MKKSARATAIIEGLLMPKKNQRLYQRRARLTAEYLIVMCVLFFSRAACYSPKAGAVRAASHNVC